jgi:hypothetical protein
MPKIHQLKTHLQKAYEKTGLSEAANRKRAIAKFAQTFGLIYFKSVNATTTEVSVIRGSTSSLDQQDTNICIGTHDGYDMVFVERVATSSFGDYPTLRHRWHIMEFDLHSHSSLPFMFIGTRQQSRTYYANLFSNHREVRHIDPALYVTDQKNFGTYYTLIASPAEQVVLTQLLTQPVTTAMAKNQLPFAVEIYGDSLYIITEATQTSVQSLTKMLHYGLWLAKHIDANIQ